MGPIFGGWGCEIAIGINVFNCLYPFSLLVFTQGELLLVDFFHLKEALVSSLGLWAVKNTLYINTFH